MADIAHDLDEMSRCRRVARVIEGHSVISVKAFPDRFLPRRPATEAGATEVLMSNAAKWIGDLP